MAPWYSRPRLRCTSFAARSGEMLSRPVAIAGVWRPLPRPDNATPVIPDTAPVGMTAEEAIAALRALTNAGADVRGFHSISAEPRTSTVTPRRRTVVDICTRAGFVPRYIDLARPAVAGPPGSAPRGAAGLARRLPRSVPLERSGSRTAASSRYVDPPRVRVRDVTAGRQPLLICDGGRTNHALAADMPPPPP